MFPNTTGATKISVLGLKVGLGLLGLSSAHACAALAMVNAENALAEAILRLSMLILAHFLLLRWTSPFETQIKLTSPNLNMLAFGDLG